MRFWISFAVILLAALPVFAQNNVNELTPDNIAKNTMAVTPQMQQQYMAKFNNMTPQQRAALVKQAQDAWTQIPQAQKDMIKEKALEQYQALTPEQKSAMQQQAMDKWQSISPQEKQQLVGQFQGLLQGNMQEDPMVNKAR